MLLLLLPLLLLLQLLLQLPLLLLLQLLLQLPLQLQLMLQLQLPLQLPLILFSNPLLNVAAFIFESLVVLFYVDNCTCSKVQSAHRLLRLPFPKVFQALYKLQSSWLFPSTLLKKVLSKKTFKNFTTHSPNAFSASQSSQDQGAQSSDDL